MALAGEQVLIGSRDRCRANRSAEELSKQAPSAEISGDLNEAVASRSGPVFITVPYAAQRVTLPALKGPLAGKVVVDVVAPVAVSDGVARALPVAEGSAALEAQALLPASHLVAAFHTISARDLLAADRPVESDVVVCAVDADAKATVMKLAEKIPGTRAVDGGGLENARYVEDFTALLMNINRLYKAHSAIRIVGI